MEFPNISKNDRDPDGGIAENMGRVLVQLHKLKYGARRSFLRSAPDSRPCALCLFLKNRTILFSLDAAGTIYRSI